MHVIKGNCHILDSRRRFAWTHLSLELTELVKLHSLQRMTSFFIHLAIQIDDLILVDACLSEIAKSHCQENSPLKEVFLELHAVNTQEKVLCMVWLISHLWVLCQSVRSFLDFLL